MFSGFCIDLVSLYLAAQDAVTQPASLLLLTSSFLLKVSRPTLPLLHPSCIVPRSVRHVLAHVLSRIRTARPFRLKPLRRRMFEINWRWF
jgi:hypothetical protein